MNIMQLLHPVSFEDLTEYALNGKKADRGEIVEAHLPTCTRCSAQVRRLRLIREAFQLDDAQSPPAELYTRAQSILAMRPRASRKNAARATLFRPRPLFARAALVAAILLLLLGAFFVTSTVSPLITDAIPGDSLYVLKIAGESMQLALAFDTVSNLQAHLFFAQNRVTEIDKLTSLNRTDQIPDTLSAFRNELVFITSAFDKLISENPTTAKDLEPTVMKMLSHSGEVLNAAMALAPAPVQVVMQIAIDEVTQAQTQIVADLEKAGPGPTETPTIQSTPTELITETPTAKPTTPVYTPTVKPVIVTQPSPTREDDEGTPTPGHVPPGQTKTPPGQDKTPSGQGTPGGGSKGTIGGGQKSTPEVERH
jgi:hypothetical protein